MFIQTETTPNPQTLKFLPGQTVLEHGTAVFTSLEEAKAQSPLAEALLQIEHVSGVFFGSNFITVTRSENEAWDTLKPAILTTIMEHLLSEAPVMKHTGGNISAGEDYSEDDQQIVNEIKELIEERVRPAVAQDGGDIIFRGYKAGIVTLEMHGACSGCPSSTITLKNGIENMLKYYVPEVQSVEAV